MYPHRHLPLALFLAASYPLASHAGEAEPVAAVAVVAESTEAAAAAPAPVADPAPVNEVVVKGARQNYRALSATGATKTDTLLKDLPQSVRVLTADLLRDVGVTNLASALPWSMSTSRSGKVPATAPHNAAFQTAVRRRVARR